MQSLGSISLSFLLAYFTCFPCALGAQESPAAAPSTVPVPSEESPLAIRFVAHNLRNYLPMDRRVDGQFVENAPKPEAEIRSIVDILTTMKPDLLGLCEIGGEPELLDLQKRLATRGLHLPHHHLHQGADPTRKLAFLSKFPLQIHSITPPPSYRIGLRRLGMQRGILDVSLQLRPHLQLRLCGVHLKSKLETPGLDQALMRRNEAHLLRLHCDQILRQDPAAKLIVYGDLNDTRNETSIKSIFGSFGTPTYLSPAPLEDQHGQRWTHHWRTADIYARIDFILTSSALRPYLQLDRSYVHHSPNWDLGSDHRPLLLHLEFPPGL